MELIDNISRLLGDDLKQTIRPGARLKIAASCFSMYASEALIAELEKIDELEFIFTSPTFVANESPTRFAKNERNSTFQSSIVSAASTAVSFKSSCATSSPGGWWLADGENSRLGRHCEGMAANQYDNTRRTFDRYDGQF